MGDVVEREVTGVFLQAIRLIGFFLLFLMAIAFIVLNSGAYHLDGFQPRPHLYALVLAFLAGAFVMLGIPIRVRADKANGEARENEFRPLASDPDTKPIFSTTECVKFYGLISDVYDSRLTRAYLDTQRKLADLIERYQKQIGRPIHLLDLGAGTGSLMRALERNSDIEWTCVEPCRGMEERLTKLFQGPPVEPRIYSTNIESFPDISENKRFDIIVLCFVLSSLPSVPDLTRYINCLSDVGILVVCDGHPPAAKDVRPFRVTTLSGTYSLDIVHMHAGQLRDEICSFGFEAIPSAQFEIKKDGKPYSFGMAFAHRRPHGALKPHLVLS